MAEAKTELFDLQIVEGSFVDKGDNPEAHIAFFKRSQDQQESESDSVKSYLNMEEKDNHYMEQKEDHYGEARTMMDLMHDEKMKEIKQHLMQSVYEILCHAEPEQWSSMLSQSLDDLNSVLDDMGHNINQDQDASVVVDGLTEERVTKKKTDNVFDDVIASLSDEQRQVIEEKINETVKAANEVVAEKSAQAEDIAKRLESLEKRAEAAESEVAKMLDEKLMAQFTKRAKDIGCGDVEKVAAILKSAYARSNEEGVELEAQFKAMAAQAKIGQEALFKSVGTTATGSDDASPEVILDSATKRIMESDSSLGYRDAYKLALAQNRDVYSRMINSRGIAE
jgi:uncharacterized protein (DUF2267 family)